MHEVDFHDCYFKNSPVGLEPGTFDQINAELAVGLVEVGGLEVLLHVGPIVELFPVNASIG